ncbi:hypothetical protein BMS3Bbin03_01063 [bacterium BMS3Bbin03]|nr:hypothetical protein BMS3Bbin03_01063 [bacterium BMS3Bbin03]
MAKKQQPQKIEVIKHGDAKRKNIPVAGLPSTRQEQPLP